MSRGVARGATRAFTLIELLVVMGIIAILLALLVPAYNTIKGGSDVTAAAYSVSGALETARTYALANNTYVWVGFFEEDGSQSSQNPAVAGTGRVVIALVASKDGTRYSDTSSTPSPFGNGSTSNQVKLALVSNLIRLNNIHLGSLNDGLTTGSSNVPARPGVAAAYQVGDPAFNSHASDTGSSVSNITTFTYPLTYTAGQTGQYNFVKIIEINPQGETSKIVENTFSGRGLQPHLEIAMQPTRGSTLDSRYTGTNSAKAAAAVQVEGLTGQVKIYRQ